MAISVSDLCSKKIPQLGDFLFDQKNKKTYKVIKIPKVGIFFISIFKSLNHDLWIDELDWTIRFLDVNSFEEMIIKLLQYGYNLPLYYIIMYFIFKFISTNEFILVLPSIVFSILL